MLQTRLSLLHSWVSNFGMASTRPMLLTEAINMLTNMLTNEFVYRPKIITISRGARCGNHCTLKSLSILGARKK